jgi:HTH-type transcriptional regulator/antitoxin MqsA
MLRLPTLRTVATAPDGAAVQVRAKMGLTQRQAGTLIGGGPNAFQKYEAGDVTVSKGISNFLRPPCSLQNTRQIAATFR